MKRDENYIRKKRRRERIGFWLAVLLLPLSILLFDGQQRLVISRYDCPVEGLPQEFEDFRIVQLSDLHGAKFGADNSKLLEAVRKQQPDLIALTGDFVEEPTDLKVTETLLPELVKIAPCYFISGNHEWASGCMPELSEQMDRYGVEYLSNEYCTLTRGNGAITLCGVEDPNSWADLVPPDRLVAQAAVFTAGQPIILLGHRNYWLREYPDLPVELILCGHGHGGVVRIPGVGALIGTDRLLFPEHADGIHASGSYHMIVSRGLGKIRGLPRIFNNPEIVVATLKKEA